MAAAAIAVIPTLDKRPIKNTICLFDVDGTLTPARQVCFFPPITSHPCQHTNDQIDSLT